MEISLKKPMYAQIIFLTLSSMIGYCNSLWANNTTRLVGSTEHKFALLRVDQRERKQFIVSWHSPAEPASKVPIVLVYKKF